jgi:hypothetical protein
MGEGEVEQFGLAGIAFRAVEHGVGQRVLQQLLRDGVGARRVPPIGRGGEGAVAMGEVEQRGQGAQGEAALLPIVLDGVEAKAELGVGERAGGKSRGLQQGGRKQGATPR